jgi:hypothetical protein
MRKRLITPTPETVGSPGESWLDVDRTAIVEFTSEDKDYPVESAFASGEAQGWRAAMPGSQTIRLIFDQPQKLKHISFVFEENETARTQEFVLRSSDGRSSSKELCASSGISARPKLHARSRNIRLSFQTSASSS